MRKSYFVRLFLQSNLKVQVQKGKAKKTWKKVFCLKDVLRCLNMAAVPGIPEHVSFMSGNSLGFQRQFSSHIARASQATVLPKVIPEGRIYIYTAPS